ncbi:hypothetical protein BC829DRAFT_393552 [Chytridium lagenaria]|nr:hypothetical protein BC829DRAFT_393552 [Chytridium lagenaria]
MAIGGLNPVPVANFNVRSTNNRTVLVRPADPSDMDKPKKKKGKKFAWMQRDSLASRLFIGKLGSRRRQRYDNNHFTDHPLVDPSEPFKPKDAFPGPSQPRPKTVFSLVPAALRQRVLATTPTAVPPTTPVVRIGASAMTKADRALRRDLRKGRWVEEEVVRCFEEEVLAFLEGGERGSDGEIAESVVEDSVVDLKEILTPIVYQSNASVATGSSLASIDSDDEERVMVASSLDDDMSRISLSSASSGASSPWVNVSTPFVDGLWVWVDSTTSGEGVEERKVMALVITDKSVRAVLHALCRWYGLMSHSEDDAEGQRITFIYKPAKAVVFKAQELQLTDATRSIDETEKSKGVEVPAISFVDYLFS